MKSIIKYLFHPWISAHYWAAYYLFTLSDEYLRKLDYGGPHACVNHFDKYAFEEYIILSFKMYWFRILFMPWTFQYHVDFDYEDLSEFGV